MKTIEQWLNELPDGYRERALSNADKEALESKEKELEMCDALWVAFKWALTAEGHLFWMEVFSYYARPVASRTLPPLPKEEP